MEQLTGEPARVIFDLRNRNLNTIRLDGARIQLTTEEVRGVHHALLVSEIKRQPAMVSVDFSLDPRITLSRGLNDTPHGRHALWIEKVLSNGDVLVRDQRYPDRPAIDLSFHELIRIVDGLVIGCTEGPSVLDEEARIDEMRERMSKMTVR